MLHLDTGNTAFMLLCASLVMLMTPGLAFFYGGLVGRKNVLAIMMQSFVSMGWTTVLWWAFGFSLCFSGDQKKRHGPFGNYRQPELGGPPRDHARHALT
jgi:ammonia channel protein AmtB